MWCWPRVHSRQIECLEAWADTKSGPAGIKRFREWLPG